MTILLLALHVLSAMFWVGGMLFAHVALRPAAALLEAPQRLALWRGVFGRFLPRVAGAIVVLLATGIGLVFAIFAGGFENVPLYVTLMMTIGIVMMLLFGHLYFALWPRFRRAVDGAERETAAAALLGIRRVVEINLALGLATVVIATTGRYWG